MLNFDYYNPTHIVFGTDRIKELDCLIDQDAKVLITYGGGSVKKFGTLEKVVAALGDREIVEFGGIEPNPQYTTLMKAVEIVRSENIDFILAVGGGSVIDGTKFIAQASHYEGPSEELLTYGFAPTPATNVCPIGTVLTLPATGSEMNNGGVITFEGAKHVVMNPFAFPRFSVLDPTLTYTLPTTQIANGVVDTFVHTVEQYVTFPAEARFQDRTAEGILQTLIEVGKATIDNPEDYDARANLMWCATNALNGLIGAGVPQDWTIHMIGHEITALYGIDHAKTLAIILPAVWKVRKEQKCKKLVQYAERVLNITEGDDCAKIDKAIEQTVAFFEDLGIKTRLSDYDLGSECVDTIVNALEAHGMTALSEDGTVTIDVSREIVTAAL